MTRAATAPHHEPLLVAVYQRVSSAEQREKESIETQTFVIDRYLSDHPELRAYKHYLDDGVSGSIPLAQRPKGRKLVEDAMAGLFTKVLVTRADRLGRDARDLLSAFSLLEGLGIELVGITESLDDYLTFGVKAVVSDHEKRRFLERSAEGMERIVRAGYYAGGIIPLGYMPDGQKPRQKLVPSDILMWRDMTEADLVRWIYDRLALDRWSCPRIAKELNAMGVPTAYAKDRRYVRGKRTEETWRPARIANLVHNSVYRGVYVHNKRSRKLDLILVECERLVSDEIWYAAKETLASNFIMAKNTTRHYFLRSLIKCGRCGHAYTGSWQKTGVRYRCCGALTRLQKEERCLGKEIKGSLLEEPVWADLEHYLRNPGGILHDLLQEMEDASQVDPRVERRAQLQSALAARQVEKQRLLRGYLKEVITLEEFELERVDIDTAITTLELGLEELGVEETPEYVDMATEDLLDQLRQRLDSGLSDEDRHEVARLLVKGILLHTDVDAEGKKKARAHVTYRFPVVVKTCTGTGSLPLST